MTIHPAAAREAREAHLWYSEHNPAAAEAFAHALRAAFTAIAANPARWPTHLGARRVVLQSFPFDVVFRVALDGAPRVLAIAHHRRRPNYWAARR